MEDTAIRYQGRFLRLIERDGWEYIERTNASAVAVVVAVTDDDHWILIEQHRPPLGQAVIEMPAGLVADIVGAEDEDAVEAARRELLEETGYAAAEISFLTAGPPSAGQSTEIVSLYLATGLRRVGEGGGDASEDIIVHRVPLDDADAWLADKAAEGCAIDPKNYAGLYFARRLRK